MLLQTFQFFALSLIHLVLSEEAIQKHDIRRESYENYLDDLLPLACPTGAKGMYFG